MEMVVYIGNPSCTQYILLPVQSHAQALPAGQDENNTEVYFVKHCLLYSGCYTAGSFYYAVVNAVFLVSLKHIYGNTR